MSDEVLRLRGVAVRRDRSALIRDVDWTVRSGESWVVIGPNGAGKTTLLQVAAAQLPPTEGQAEILGEDLATADVSTCGPGSAWPARRWRTWCRPRRRSSTWC